LEDDPGGEPPRIPLKKAYAFRTWTALAAGAGLLCYFALADTAAVLEVASSTDTRAVPWYTILTPGIGLVTLILVGLSAFFSASEVAFLSLNNVELRSMGASSSWLLRLIAHLMTRPGSLLTTILMGNTIVNIILSITIAEPLADVFKHAFLAPAPYAYAASVVLTTCVLLFFGEISPKVIAALQPRAFAITAVVPLYLIYQVMTPFRYVAMLFVGFIFRITRLSEVRPAPFLTDDEFLSILSESEASGIIEEEERHMIEGILEFGDVTLDEILVPRPDIIGIREEASISEALETVRMHEYARMPVYREDLDHITGILYAKDLLPVMEEGGLDRPVSAYMRRPHFAPATMSVGNFVKMAQRLRIHIAIVVDEFGGTEGLVTLQDAIREVVGDIGEEDDEEEPMLTTVGPGEWQIGGNCPLEEFEQHIGITSGDEEHTTVAGFLMSLSDKILKPGDELEYSGLHFVIREVDKKRVTRVMVLDKRHSGSENGNNS